MPQRYPSTRDRVRSVANLRNRYRHNGGNFVALGLQPPSTRVITNPTPCVRVRRAIKILPALACSTRCSPPSGSEAQQSSACCEVVSSVTRWSARLGQEPCLEVLRLGESAWVFRRLSEKPRPIHFPLLNFSTTNWGSSRKTNRAATASCPRNFLRSIVFCS